MKKTLLLAAVTMGFIWSLSATQKYNFFEDRWETVRDDWEIEYNPFENSWSYQPDDAQVEYNPFENSWDWNSGHNFLSMN